MSAILLIDDDAEVLQVNQKFLTGEGFQVLIADSGAKGLALAKKYQPDCIVLDVMMPEMDGFEVCSQLRSFTIAPILFLTGKGSEDDKIQGLTTGADDYIVKPYSLRELKARIDVLLRRAGQINAVKRAAEKEKVLTFGSLTIDKLGHKAFFKGDDLNLANREYEVLLFLAEHPGQEITFEQLGKALFGTYQESDRRSIMVNMSRLRKKMDFDYELENMIETVWGKGYRFLGK